MTKDEEFVGETITRDEFMALLDKYASDGVVKNLGKEIGIDEATPDAIWSWATNVSEPAAH